MIGNVEELGAKLYVRAFTNSGVLQKREIKVVETGPDHDIASGVSKRQLRVGDKSRGVEPALHGFRSRIGIAHHVGPIVSQPGAAVVLPSQH